MAHKLERAHKGEASHLYLYEKIPYTWEVIDGAWGKITYIKDKFSFNAHELETGREYTLLTYGGWNNVECFGTSVVNENGDFHLNGVFDFSLLTDEPNKVPVKIWLVPSTSVNCETNKMTVWNPTEYLFEQN